MDEMTKEQRIENERQRLAVLFDDLDANQLQTARGLIASAAFLAVTLEDLEKEINAGGCIEEYQNGRDQYGVKVAASVQAYTALNAKYQSTMQKLLKIVPPAPDVHEKNPVEIAAEKAAALEKEKQEHARQRQKRRDFDFLAACKAGETSAEHYQDFCRQWEEENAE